VGKPSDGLFNQEKNHHWTIIDRTVDPETRIRFVTNEGEQRSGTSWWQKSVNLVISWTKRCRNERSGMNLSHEMKLMGNGIK